MEEPKNKYILGIKISTLTSKEILDTIKGFLLSESGHYIITLNPEMIVEAQSKDIFKEVVNHADLCIADGIGILIADKMLNGGTSLERIPGIDLIYKICGSEFTKERKIFMLGAGKGIAEKAASILQNRYPGMNIVGAEEGMRFESPKFKVQSPKDHTEQNLALIQRINDAKPSILFVAFGAPKQEMWIYENLKKIPSVRLAIGVGGSFDFISGRIRRAPKVLRNIGLEWLWRLIREPKRIKRIYNATIKFGWLVLRSKFI